VAAKGVVPVRPRSWAVALALSAAACGQAEPAPPAELLVAGVADPEPLQPDPMFALTRAAAGLVYEPACRWDAARGLVPAAARICRRDGPGDYWLEPDPARRFSDGSPLAAEDLARTARRAGLDASLEGRGLRVRAPDGARPVEALLSEALVWRPGTPDPIGTGPFTPVPRGAGAGRIELRRREPVPGRLDRVAFEALPGSRECLARALRGEVDAVLGLDARQWEILEDVPDLQVVRGPSPHAVAVVFNAKALGRDERRALADSLPLGELAAAYGESCRPARPRASGPVPEGRPLSILVMRGDPALWRVGLALRRALGPRGGALRFPAPGDVSSWHAHRGWDLLLTPVMHPSFPGAALHFHSRARDNLPGLVDPEADAALERGDLLAFAQAMERNPPASILCGRDRTLAVTARVRDPSPGWWRALDTLPEWEVTP
jgi:hypothetical protein